MEKVAKQERSKSIFATDSEKIKVELTRLEENFNEYNRTITTLTDLKSYESYKAFENFYHTNKENLKKSYEHKLRYYSFKRTMQAFAFLLPIWLLFYLAYKWMLKNQHYILSHLTLHVANVAALYALGYLISFVYDIIPKLFFEKIIAFFMQHNMAIVLNIIAILFFIFIFGIVIYRVQKHDTTGEKKRNQEISNLKMGKCAGCGCVIDGEYCYICGFHHYIPCEACQKKTLAKAEFCMHCGQSIRKRS